MYFGEKQRMRVQVYGDGSMYYGQYYYGRREKKKVVTNDEYGIPRTKYEYSMKNESEWVPLKCPFILGDNPDEARNIFDRAAKILGENKKSGKFGDYAFSGKIRCALTGYTYVGTRNRHGTVCYKIHQSKSKPNHDRKLGIQVLEEELVEMVMVFLKDLIGTPSSQLEEFLRENAYKESRMEAYTEELVVIDKKLEQIAPKINNLLNALAELGDLGSDVKEKVAELGAERKTLSDRKAVIQQIFDSTARTKANAEEVRERFKFIKTNLLALPYETKRDLAKSITEKVEIDFDRHYHIELSISEDIKKYFDKNDNSDDSGDSGGVADSKKPRRPRNTSGGGASYRDDKDGEFDTTASVESDGGQISEKGVIHSSSPPNDAKTRPEWVFLFLRIGVGDRTQL